MLVRCQQRIKKEEEATRKRIVRYKPFSYIFADNPLVDKMVEFSTSSCKSSLTAANHPSRVPAFFARITPSIFSDAKRGNFAAPLLFSYDRAWLIGMREWHPEEQEKLFRIRDGLVACFRSKMQELQRSVDPEELLAFLENQDGRLNVFLNLMALHENPDDQRFYARRDPETSHLKEIKKIIGTTIAQIRTTFGFGDDILLVDLRRKI